MPGHEDQSQESPVNPPMVEAGKEAYDSEKWKEIASYRMVPFNEYSLGTAKFLKERTFDVSDCFRVHVCTKCGLFAQANLENQEFTCLNCSSLDHAFPIYQVNLPYAAKTLIQELIAMHIAPRLKFDL
jgi:hypothetical protein